MITFLLLAASVASAQMRHSPTLAVLEGEASRDPFAPRSLEGVRKSAAVSFTGETDTQTAPVVVDPSGKTYVMEGTAPMPGINIYKPKLDPDGNGRTEKPEAKPLIDPKLSKRAFALGGLAGVGGVAAVALGGSAWVFAPLLLIAGALLGAGFVLRLIGKKTQPKG